jgi:DNA polymerase-3 subunit epsilon
MNKLSFTALDIETADNSNHFICQIGLVKVINGIISEKYMSLVKPPNNFYSYHNTKVHGINSQMTEEAPSIGDIWPIINHLIDGQLVVCHNASFDIQKLENTLNYHSIELPNFEIACTYKIYGKNLTDCCASFSIEIGNHHDALADAEACALLYLKSLQDEISTEKLIQKEKANSEFSSYFSQKQIAKDDLVPDFENCCKSNPFYMKKIVLTGDLKFISRKDIAHELKIRGADVNTGISKKTDIVIIGDSPGPVKLQKIEELKQMGYIIQLIFEDELISFMNNN